MTNQTQRGSILTDIRSLEHFAYPTARAHPSVRMPALCAPVIVVEPPQPRRGAVLIDAPDCAARESPRRRLPQWTGDLLGPLKPIQDQLTLALEGAQAFLQTLQQ
jgi:hypothetical protein